ncbi:putative oxidoreductase [Tistlia consotensis]|uniref:Putative oxidoreductase n=1 Tax=Tistlia consotensis USBA 355 TaxID=560819 RepID=A0A1Y6BNT6_9PROT|nr:DoxX family protein [Tistlia consotensis]SMF17371.1 putative oxidoreductase [Tistlia consotensis USBA 355]SNR40487.1 putative oxidoreductase [Tistlia consotensis]
MTDVLRLARFALDPGPTARWSQPGALIAGLVLLAARLWLGWAFLMTGLHRVMTWDSQAFLFMSVHPVPYVPAEIAAPLTTTAELVLPSLLIAGLLARPAALGLMVMAATIYFVIGQTPEGMENGIALASEQFPWMAVGLAIAAVGAGQLSLDALARSRLGRRSPAE